MSLLQCSKCGSLQETFQPEGIRCATCFCLKSYASDSNKLLDEVVQISQEDGQYDTYLEPGVDENGALTMHKGGLTSVVDEYEQQIIKWCEDLRCKLIDKYRKGKEEHGDLANGKPLDCAKEISNEVADILIYHCIDVVQKGK